MFSLFGIIWTIANQWNKHHLLATHLYIIFDWQQFSNLWPHNKQQKEKKPTISVLGLSVFWKKVMINKSGMNRRLSKVRCVNWNWQQRKKIATSFEQRFVSNETSEKLIYKYQFLFWLPTFGARLVFFFFFVLFSMFQIDVRMEMSYNVRHLIECDRDNEKIQLILFFSPLKVASHMAYTQAHQISVVVLICRSRTKRSWWKKLSQFIN